MRTAIITGASGFIGHALALRLAGNDYRVYGLNRKGCATALEESQNFRLLSYDEPALASLPMNADVFVHLAWDGITNGNYRDVGVQLASFNMTVDMLRLALRQQCQKFILAGTNQSYLLDTNPLDGKPGFCSIYGSFKLACRDVGRVLAFGKMAFCTASFTNVFGIGDTSRRTANSFIAKLSKGLALDLIEGTNLYDWTYIDDAVGGLAAVIERGVNNRDYYIGSRKLRTFREIITEVRDVVNSAATLNWGRFQDTSYTDYSLFDLDALYRDTGFQCRCDFRESILKTAEWVKTLDL